jgi:hypothetical protein
MLISIVIKRLSLSIEENRVLIQLGTLRLGSKDNKHWLRGRLAVVRDPLISKMKTDMKLYIVKIYRTRTEA